jgi:hypothetical protein
MKLNPRHAPPISRPPARRSATARLLATVLALCLFLSGCDVQMEWTPPGYTVYNYSSSSYIVRMTYAGGAGNYLVVPPLAKAGELWSSDPVEAVVYDGSCLATLATVTVSGPSAVIYIDEAGHFSTSAPTGPLSTESLPDMRPGPVPSSCPVPNAGSPNG